MNTETGEIRRIAEGQLIRPDEIPLTEEQAAGLEKLPPEERVPAMARMPEPVRQTVFFTLDKKSRNNLRRGQKYSGLKPMNV